MLSPEGERLKPRNGSRLSTDRAVMPRLLRPETYRARQLRRDSTPAETVLWRLLRGRRIDGVKFRRQQPLGPFVGDFVCFEARLVVEADGARHFPKPLRDRVRDQWLRACGFVVLRFPNNEILRHPERVVERIRAALRRPTLLPSGDGLG